MPDLGNAYVNIVPRAPDIQSKVEGLLSGGGAGAGAERAGLSIGKKLMGGIAAIGIGAAIGETIKSAFEAGGDLEQSFGGLDTIYGEASAAAKQFAMDAAQAGISANDYAEQAVSFGASLKQAFGGDTTAAVNAANTAIMDMADNAAKMGTPIENLQNAYQGFAKQNYTMLDNLKLGYGGTKQEMERLLADAEKFSGIHYDISNLGDVYQAIHVIQGELGLTGVAAEEASTTLQGSMNSVKASWENVMAALTTGEGLETAMDNLTKAVGAFAENVLRMLSELAPQLPGLILGLADVILDNAPEFIAAGVELIAQLAVGLIAGLPDLLAKIPEIFDRMRAAFAQYDWGEIGINIVRGLINGLASAASGLWQSINNMAESAWQRAKNALGISSPSKVFADEVGQWIPAGMAEGIEDNLDPVSKATQLMTDTSLNDIQTVKGTASTQQTNMTPEAIQQLIDALREFKFDFYMDGKQITDSVTIRQRNALRAGGAAW